MAGSGAAGRLAPRLRARLESRGVEYVMVQSERVGHAAELAREAAAAGVRCVMAVGGDGTVHEVANGLLTLDAHPPLAVLPVGTGNDFHRMVGVKRSIDAAIDLVETGTCDRFEVGRARWDRDERFFVNVLGVGIDTEVIRRRDGYRRLPGLAQYLAAVVVTVFRYHPLELEVHLDGDVTFAGSATLATVCVGPSIGGGFRVTPEASPRDGALDLLFVDALGPLQALRYVPRVLRGTHAGLPVVRMHRLKSARLASPTGEPFFFELDGELIEEPVRQLEIDVLPESLNVLRPPGARA